MRKMYVLSILCVLLILASCSQKQRYEQKSPPVQQPIEQQPTVELDKETPEEDTETVSYSPLDEVEPTALMLQMKNMTGIRYDFAFNKGVMYSSAFDDKGFILVWTPEGFDPKTDSILVNLGGHDTSAFDDFYLWYDIAKEHGYGLVSLQWWFGKGEEANDYASPEQMYPVIQDTLKYLNAEKESVLMTGFSRGSANVYMVTALDKSTENNYFAATLANSGSLNDPAAQENDPLLNGAYGEKPFEGTHWIMYCGTNDEYHTISGCQAMNETKIKLEDWGATIDLFIEDPTGGHGGFQTNSENVAQALETFDAIRKGD